MDNGMAHRYSSRHCRSAVLDMYAVQSGHCGLPEADSSVDSGEGLQWDLQWPGCHVLQQLLSLNTLNGLCQAMPCHAATTVTTASTQLVGLSLNCSPHIIFSSQ